jgi:hypothetical protein
MLSILLKRDWTCFWNDQMKFGAMIANALMKILLVGFLFMNEIPTR